MKETLDIAFLKGTLWRKVCMCSHVFMFAFAMGEGEEKKHL
jgi:hypothetical protein